jgi:ferredoxin-NADP reductase
MNVKFVSIQPETKNVSTFRFRPEKPFKFIAGQFIELSVPHSGPDERGEKRWFTLSSAPSEEYVSITTRFSGDTASTYKKALFSSEIGTEFTMSSPMGDFILPKNASIPVIFVAAGIGCTPFHSIVYDLQLCNIQRDITLIYAAKSEEDIAFKDTFEKLGESFIALTDKRLQADQILKIASPHSHVYLSGPEPLVENLQDDLLGSGFQKRQLHTDFFPGYTAI